MKKEWKLHPTAFPMAITMLKHQKTLRCPISRHEITLSKYETGGVPALQDNRGKRKSEDSLTEMEKLQAELKLEKAKRQRAEMELSFLKKLEEIERRRG